MSKVDVLNCLYFLNFAAFTFRCRNSIDPFICSLEDEYLYNLLNNLSTPWTGSLELMQPPCTGETREQVSRSSVYYIPITGSHSTQLAGLQQRLRSNVLDLHPQAFLAVPLGELTLLVQSRRAWPFAFSHACCGNWSVSCGMGGQDDWV